MDQNNKIYPVILAGGAGVRLWPLSQPHRSKQFLNLAGIGSLFEQTCKRVASTNDFLNPLVVCNKDSAHQILQIEDSQNLSLIVEPASCNTAIAVAVATQFALTKGNPLLLILPSDHYIENKGPFVDSLKKAKKLAYKKIVIFGIEPTKVMTDYGYIERDEAIGEGFFSIKKFTEKPDYKKAMEYVESNNYFWNSGMILSSAKILQEELERCCPEVVKIATQCIQTLEGKEKYYVIQENGYAQCAPEPIDIALLEKTKNIVFYPLRNIGWSDLGSWSSLWEVNPKDNNDNVIFGKAVPQDVSNSFLYSASRSLVVTNLDNCVVVETPDAVLVTQKDSQKNIKGLIEACAISEPTKKVELRPWGSFEVLEEGAVHKVKKIIVKPNQSLSLQVHQKRDEHWVVVRGKPTITKGEETFELTVNQHVFIPKETKHRIQNNTNNEVELIEVQTGSYLGEDDIIRLSDQYNRVTQNKKYA